MTKCILWKQYASTIGVFISASKLGKHPGEFRRGSLFNLYPYCSYTSKCPTRLLLWYDYYHYKYQSVSFPRDAMCQVKCQHGLCYFLSLVAAWLSVVLDLYMKITSPTSLTKLTCVAVFSVLKS